MFLVEGRNFLEGVWEDFLELRNCFVFWLVLSICSLCIWKNINYILIKKRVRKWVEKLSKESILEYIKKRKRKWEFERKRDLEDRYKFLNVYIVVFEMKNRYSRLEEMFK